MKKAIQIAVFPAVLSAFSLLSCVASPTRQPSSVEDDLHYLEALASSQLLNELELDRQKQHPHRGGEQTAPEENLRLVKKNIQLWGERFQNEIPQIIETKFQTPWRAESEKIVLKDIQNYEIAESRKPAVFAMDLAGAKSYQLELKNMFYSGGLEKSQQISLHEPGQKGALFLGFSLLCDGDFKISKTLMTLNGKAGKTLNFKLYDEKFNGERTVFVPGAKLHSCRVHFSVPEEPQRQYGFEISDGSRFVDDKAAHQQLLMACLLPKTDAIGPVEKFFLTDQFRSMTCPQSVREIREIPMAMDGLIAKLETLLGRTVSEEWVMNYMPDSAVDFSSAPHFDEIDITYLVFRNDFEGSLLRRVLEHHARQGTIIRILVAGVIELEKDRKSFELLTAKYPNLKVHEYKWKSSHFADLGDLFNSLHRDNHVKMFLTYSAANPNLNTAMVGGRNIHDGFVFKDPRVLSEFPELVQYPKDEAYAHWRDMEYQIKDRGVVKSLIGHYMTLWELDSQTFYQRSINLNVSTAKQVDPKYFESTEPLVRHLMSIPFKDQQSLEKFYVGMFDSAEKEIQLSTPYFNITEEISQAVKRALARGVKVSLITRLDLKGDTVDFVLSDVNKKAVNQFRDQFQVYEYTVPGEILHSKIVLVDGKLAFVGGVNLNRRSFIHDTENGILVYNPEFYQRMNNILVGYRKNARLITEPQKIKFINKIILSMPFLNDAL